MVFLGWGTRKYKTDDEVARALLNSRGYVNPPDDVVRDLARQMHRNQALMRIAFFICIIWVGVVIFQAWRS